MKKLLLGSVSALVLGIIPPAKARPLAPPPVFSWTGCYVGAHAGYGWGNSDWSSPTYHTGWLMSHFGADGWLGGGQLGCNYQFPASNWIVGIEGSIAAANIQGTGNEAGGYVLDVDHAKTTALGSITGRLGWNGLDPHHLFYVKGGWASVKDEFRQDYPGAPPGTYYSSSQNRSGWTLGGGWEWAFSPKWSTFIEYDYYDFGSKVTYGPTYFAAIKQTINTIKIGVNFHWMP